MSETNNQYWNGRTHAVLRQSDISASWGSGDYCLQRIDAANRAFCIWYHAQRTLMANPIDSNYTAMRISIESCAKSGSGLGVSDLQEALDHIDRNGGRWSDGNTTTYFGGDGKSYKRGLIADMPESCANFLAAVDDQLPGLKEALQQYQTQCQALQRLRLTADSSTDWERIKTAIDTIKTTAERIKPLMWIVPAGVQATVPRFSMGTSAARRIDDFASAGTARINQTISFLDTVGNIHDALTVYVDATRATGGNRRAGAAFAALTFAMTFVPVLGTFYGTIIQKIPGLITSWTDFMEEYHRTRLHPEFYLRPRASRPAAWQCNICHSSGGY